MRKLTDFARGCRAVMAVCLFTAVPSISEAEGSASNSPVVAGCAAGFEGPIISTSTLSYPDPGQEVEAEIGQSIISTSQGNILSGALVLRQAASVSGNYFKDFTVDIPSGTYASSQGKYGWSYLIKNSVFRYGTGNPRHGIAKPDTSLFYDVGTGLLSARVSLGFTNKIIVVPHPDYTIEKCLSISAQGFRRELLYSGVSKGTVTLQYREFINDFARPAFSQELKYDLSEGNEIGYKGARFLIIRASNTALRFKLIKPLD